MGISGILVPWHPGPAFLLFSESLMPWWSLPAVPSLIPTPSIAALFPGQEQNLISDNPQWCLNLMGLPDFFFSAQHLGWALCSSPGERQVNNSG